MKTVQHSLTRHSCQVLPELSSHVSTVIFFFFFCFFSLQTAPFDAFTGFKILFLVSSLSSSTSLPCRFISTCYLHLSTHSLLLSSLSEDPGSSLGSQIGQPKIVFLFPFSLCKQTCKMRTQNRLRLTFCISFLINHYPPLYQSEALNA